MTILYTYNAYNSLEAIGFIVFIVFGIVLTILAAVSVALCDEYTIGVIMAVAAILALFLAFKMPATDTMYKITIDDNVTAKELYEQYEIISQEGLIYTVKDKPQVEFK